MAIKASTWIACAVGALMIVQANALVDSHHEKVKTKAVVSAQRHAVNLCKVMAADSLQKSYIQSHQGNTGSKSFNVPTPEACERVLDAPEAKKLSGADGLYTVHKTQENSSLRDTLDNMLADSYRDQVHQLDKDPHAARTLQNMLLSMSTVLTNYETQHHLAQDDAKSYTLRDMDAENRVIVDITIALSGLLAKEALNDLPNIQPTAQEAKAHMAHLKLDPLSQHDVKIYQTTFAVSTSTQLKALGAQLDRVQEMHELASTPEQASRYFEEALNTKRYTGAPDFHL